MEIIDNQEVVSLVNAINTIDLERLKQNSGESLTDISLSIEKEIDRNLTIPINNWHIDRSRNDFQACCQLMYARKKWMNLFGKINALIHTVLVKASCHKETIMPGYTHYQSAQIISAGFYLSAVSGHLVETGKKMLDCLEKMNRSCPLGSGAMSGQEYDWEPHYMAQELGFDAYTGHALVGVASRDWIIDMGATLTFFSSNMSRFLTDLMNWGSSEYKFIDFEDELTGISSSMPQKRNFPILERIRGKTSHMISIYQDFLLGQRNTPYSNLVEVSKESSSMLSLLFKNAEDVFELLTLVFDYLQFNEETMKSRCYQDFYGGFTLANSLTQKCKIPYRKAQVIAGRFITESLERKHSPQEVSVKVLDSICQEFGYVNYLTALELKNVFDAENALYMKISTGSTHPERVASIIRKQEWEAEHMFKRFVRVLDKVEGAQANLDEWSPGKTVIT